MNPSEGNTRMAASGSDGVVCEGESIRRKGRMGIRMKEELNGERGIMAVEEI